MEESPESFFLDDFDLFVLKRCVLGELRLARHKHVTVVNMVRHVSKNQRKEAKKVIIRLIKSGLLEKHRTDTFQWSREGIEFAGSMSEK